MFLLALAISKLLAEGGDLGVDYGILRLGGIAHGTKDANRLRALVFSGMRGSLVFGVLAGLALAAAAPLVSRLLDTPELTAALVPLALSVPFTASTEVIRSGLRAMGDAKGPVASTSIITPILRLVTVLWAVSVLNSAASVAWAYLLTEVLVFVATGAMLWRTMPKGDRHASSAEGLFRFSLPMSLNRLLLYGNNQTEVVILGIFGSLSDVGIFGIARRLSVLIGSLLTSVTVLFNPVVADLHHANRTEELDHLYKTSTRWLLTLGLPICLIELLFPTQLLFVMGGNRFTAGSSALIILAVGQLVNVGTGVTSNLQAMAGHAKTTLLNSLLFLGMSVALDLALIPAFGILGAAIAAATSTIVVNLLRLWQIYSRLGLLPYDRTFIRPIAAGVPASLVAVLLPLSALSTRLELAVRVVALGVVYLAALFLLGFETIDREIARAATAKVLGRKSPALAAK